MSLKRINNTNPKNTVDSDLKVIFLYLNNKKFQRKNNFFYRSKGDFIQIIKIDRYWTKNQFAIDLVLHIKKIPILFKSKITLEERPTEKSGHINFRLVTKRDVIKNLKDHVWSLSKNNAREIIESLEVIGMPKFEELSNYKNLLRAYENDKLFSDYNVGIWSDLIGAICYEELGNYNKSLKIYKQIYFEKKYAVLGLGIIDFVKSRISQLSRK